MGLCVGRLKCSWARLPKYLNIWTLNHAWSYPRPPRLIPVSCLLFGKQIIDSTFNWVRTWKLWKFTTIIINTLWKLRNSHHNYKLQYPQIIDGQDNSLDTWRKICFIILFPLMCKESLHWTFHQSTLDIKKKKWNIICIIINIIFSLIK